MNTSIVVAGIVWLMALCENLVDYGLALTHTKPERSDCINLIVSKLAMFYHEDLGERFFLAK